MNSSLYYKARVSTRRKLTQSGESSYGCKAANIDAIQYNKEKDCLQSRPCNDASLFTAAPTPITISPSQPKGNPVTISSPWRGKRFLSVYSFQGLNGPFDVHKALQLFARLVDSFSSRNLASTGTEEADEIEAKPRQLINAEILEYYLALLVVRYNNSTGLWTRELDFQTWSAPHLMRTGAL